MYHVCLSSKRSVLLNSFSCIAEGILRFIVQRPWDLRPVLGVDIEWPTILKLFDIVRCSLRRARPVMATIAT